jgi:hypothetical protein
MDITAVGTALTAAVSDTGDVAVLVFAALAGLWVIRKVIKTINKS